MWHEYSQLPTFRSKFEVLSPFYFAAFIHFFSMLAFFCCCCCCCRLFLFWCHLTAWLSTHTHTPTRPHTKCTHDCKPICTDVLIYLLLLLLLLSFPAPYFLVIYLLIYLYRKRHIILYNVSSVRISTSKIACALRPEMKYTYTHLNFYTLI